jgi:hypothetical protein
VKSSIPKQPFVLKQHEKDHAKVLELTAQDLERITGGPLKLRTTTVIGGRGEFDDGHDEG